MRSTLLAAVVLLSLAGAANAQQVADPNADLSVARPAYAAGTGPRVAVDAAHDNFHTVDGRYAPFAQILRNDGYRVGSLATPLSAEALASVDVLVIANAQGEDASPLTSAPAFTPAEAAALRGWVEGGGSLLLIADHAPFPSAIAPLAQAFGVRWDNVYAVNPSGGGPDLFTAATGLGVSPVAAGSGGGVPVTQVRTFTGSAFTPPPDAIPLLTLGNGWVLMTPGPSGQSDATLASGAGRLQGALLPVGRGRVALMGEAAMFSAQLGGPERRPMGLNAPGAEQNKTFLLNLMRWLRPPPR